MLASRRVARCRRSGRTSARDRAYADAHRRSVARRAHCASLAGLIALPMSGQLSRRGDWSGLSSALDAADTHMSCSTCDFSVSSCVSTSSFRLAVLRRPLHVSAATDIVRITSSDETHSERRRLRRGSPQKRGSRQTRWLCDISIFGACRTHFESLNGLTCDTFSPRRSARNRSE